MEQKEANDGIIAPLPVKFKKVYEDAVLPYYGTEESAGLDCTVYSSEYLKNSNIVKYYLGFAVEIPKGYVGLIFPRSSVYKCNITMSNCVGVIDSDYRGEVTAMFYTNLLSNPYKEGERCCQLIIIPYPKIEVIEATELSETKRGTGGYGSTGR